MELSLRCMESIDDAVRCFLFAGMQERTFPVRQTLRMQPKLVVAGHESNRIGSSLCGLYLSSPATLLLISYGYLSLDDESNRNAIKRRSKAIGCRHSSFLQWDVDVRAIRRTLGSREDIYRAATWIRSIMMSFLQVWNGSCRLGLCFTGTSDYGCTKGEEGVRANDWMK